MNGVKYAKPKRLTSSFTILEHPFKWKWNFDHNTETGVLKEKIIKNTIYTNDSWKSWTASENLNRRPLTGFVKIGGKSKISSS